MPENNQHSERRRFGVCSQGWVILPESGAAGWQWRFEIEEFHFPVSLNILDLLDFAFVSAIAKPWNPEWMEWCHQLCSRDLAVMYNKKHQLHESSLSEPRIKWAVIKQAWDSKMLWPFLSNFYSFTIFFYYFYRSFHYKLYCRINKTWILLVFFFACKV